MQIALKDICNAKSLCMELDLTTPVKSREMFAISRGFYFQETKFHENKSLAKISENTESSNIYTWFCEKVGLSLHRYGPVYNPRENDQLI